MIPETTETCHKTVEDLLHNLTSKFPQLNSLLLQSMKADIGNANSMLPSLVRRLPLDLWQPEPQDLDTISQYLLNFSFESTQSQVARIIFNRLNWNFSSDENTLFLSYEIHLRTAHLICQVASKHVPETVGLTDIIVTSLVKSQNARQQFSHWCWNIASRLRLHCMDLGPRTVQQMIANPTAILTKVPELEGQEALIQGVSESRPLAIYCSLLISLCGHSVPQICEQGMDFMKLLLADSRHAIVIRCLQLVVPLFLGCPESLSTCAKFQVILNGLLNDKTYARHTKDFVVLTNQKPVLQLLADMIQHQVTQYSAFGFQTPTHLIDLWLQCLTHNQNWYTNSNCAHLMDILLKVAYQFPDAWISARNRMQKWVTFESTKAQQSSGFLGFIGGSVSSFSALLQPSAQTLWLSLMILEIEFDLLELQNGIWYELLRQLYLQTKQANINEVLKKVAPLNGLTAFPANSLVVYKLATLITNCAVDSHLFPILCQIFFR